MKTRFNTYDIVCMSAELQRLVGMRVNQIYDIDNKCYLIRLQQSEEKAILLLDSGNRFHTTQFEWPKNVAPSGFTMKLRKHLKNKRLEKLTQLGVDRIVDFQFGTGEAAYHVVLELYDRGNIVLTDYEWTILNVLRPHVEGDKIRFAVKEKYPLDRAKQWSEPPLGDALKETLTKCKPGDNLKKILNTNYEYGPGIIDHVLQENRLLGNMKITNDVGGKGFYVERDFESLEASIRQAEELLQNAKNNTAKGYIIQKKEIRPITEGQNESDAFLLANVEFHPMLYAQHKSMPYVEYASFDRCVDEFFSTLEGQKIDIKTIQVEREAMKKLQNVRKDHEKRLSELEKTQHLDREKAELITRNQDLVDQARIAIQTALANQMSWNDIKVLVKTAQERNDPIASVIKHLKLDINHITLLLTDPYEELNDSDDEEENGKEKKEERKPILVDIDLSLSAYANARKFYDQKRHAAKKQQKTLESQGKALKSAERKTKQTLKEAKTISTISKARKSYWFEKFFWFISSDNYLVIAGRDQQQNELLVKRHLRASDVYVHADVSGASSVLVKCAAPPPPRTLAEAGQAAVAYSVAWEAKVLTSAWWVHAHQVSKSAPTGEYLSTGSFMIRGKKNYLLPQHLMMGFSFMFRLEDGSIARHRDDRRPLALGEESISEATSVQDLDEEIPLSDDDESPDKVEKWNKDLRTIMEETTEMVIKVEKPTEPDPESTQSIDNKDENKDSGSSSSDSEDILDTHIKVDHVTGKVIIESKTRTLSEVSYNSDIKEDEEKPLSFPSLPHHKTQKNKLKGEANKGVQKNEESKQKEGSKRGQKGKLKKIKEKYKYQDEEERTMAAEQTRLQCALNEAKKKSTTATKTKASKGKATKIPQPAPLILEVDSDAEIEQVDAEVDNQAANAEAELLFQLTGCPVPEDELLFAVPVVAPYSALHHYKYKVKLTPGTGKRGKAAKTAVQVFLRDKSGTPRERDLLKAVRDEDVARNFPGKVKLSAPHLHKHKK